MKKPSVLLISSLIVLTGCTSPELDDYNSAQKEINKGHYHIALSFLDKSIKRNPTSGTALKAAREAARIALYELKDYKKSIEFNKHIVLISKDSQERLTAQKQIAGIYFDNLQSYSEAVIEYNKLIDTAQTDSERAQYKLSIARANYYTSSFQQANSEISELLALKIDEAVRFAALLLRGNIFIAQKDFLKAAELLRKLMKDYPQKAEQENVPLSLAVCYEESNDYKSAIELLESIKSKQAKPEYIELRIKRLRERQKNQPGARGYRK